MEFDGGGRPMEFDGGGGVQLPAPLAVTEASASAPLATSLDEESMWQMNLRVGDSIDPGPYPERSGEPDCSYYLRTGLCRFGITCRFNHPPNRKLVKGQSRNKYEGGRQKIHYNKLMKTSTTVCIGTYMKKQIQNSIRWCNFNASKEGPMGCGQ